MAEVIPSFSGEVQFRRYSDTSTQGQQIVFAVQDRDSLEPFIGKEGKRYMAVLVEIADDEQPAEVPRPVGRERLGDLCYRAVQWCRDPEFQEWICRQGQFGQSMGTNANVAAMTIRQWCGVKTRKELDANKEAGDKFRRLVIGPWQKHCIARGRSMAEAA